MIGSFLKLTALAAAAAILALTIRKQTPELSLALTAAACCAVCLLALPFVKPVLELARRLSEKTGLSYPTLRRKLRGDGCIRLEEAILIRQALGCEMPLEELFARGTRA